MELASRTNSERDSRKWRDSPTPRDGAKTWSAWAYKHRDYKSRIGGKRYVMIYRQGIGTTLEPISSISDDDLISMLSSSSQTDIKARRP